MTHYVLVLLLADITCSIGCSVSQQVGTAVCAPNTLQRCRHLLAFCSVKCVLVLYCSVVFCGVCQPADWSRLCVLVCCSCKLSAVLQLLQSRATEKHKVALRLNSHNTLQHCSNQNINQVFFLTSNLFQCVSVTKTQKTDIVKNLSISQVFS